MVSGRTSKFSEFHMRESSAASTKAFKPMLDIGDNTYDVY